MATDTAAQPRPARICVRRPPKLWPITTGFLSSLRITASKWSAICPTDLRANTSGWALASATVSGSSGQPGCTAQSPAASNPSAHRSQLLGSSHKPCTNTTGVLPDWFARSTCSSSSSVTVRASSCGTFLAMFSSTRGSLRRLGLEFTSRPGSEVGRRLVGGLQEREECGIGVIGSADRGVGQQELGKGVVVVGSVRLDPPFREACRLWVRVGVERPFAAPAGPLTTTTHLVAVSDLLHPAGAVGHTAPMLRSPSPGEARDREVGATPEEVNRARLADEAATKPRHHAMGMKEGDPEPGDGVGVVGTVLVVLREGDRYYDFDRSRQDRYLHIELVERGHRRLVE